MALLRLVDNVPGVDQYEYRDTTYYNKYDYRLRMKIPCSRYTYWCKKPEELDKKLAGKSKNSYNIRKDDIETVTENLPALKKLVEISIEKKENKNFSLRLEGDIIAIFSNDLSVLHDLKKRIGEQYALECTQAQTGGYSGVKYFTKDPKHKYRVYLRSKRVPDSFHIELREMLSRLKTLYPSPALKRWLSSDTKRYGIWHFRWASSAHFIDYDDESTLSYLALMHGDILGKKYKLEKRIDPI